MAAVLKLWRQNNSAQASTLESLLGNKFWSCDSVAWHVRLLDFYKTYMIGRDTLHMAKCLPPVLIIVDILALARILSSYMSSSGLCNTVEV